MDGGEAGTFSVRHKQPTRGENAWVLSLVKDDKSIKHYLVEDPGQGAPLLMSGEPVGNTITLGTLLDHLKDASNYHLRRVCAFSQPWYHGSITRQEAEERLDHMPFDGAFLVRGSTRAADVVVISVVAGGKVHHTEVSLDRKQWGWTVAGEKKPDLIFPSLFALVEHYEQPGCGLHGVDLTARAPVTPMTISICRSPADPALARPDQSNCWKQILSRFSKHEPDPPVLLLPLSYISPTHTPSSVDVAI